MFKNKVQGEISKRSEKGHTSAFVKTEGEDRDELFSVVEELENDGYIVKVNQREMEIFWYDETSRDVGKLV